MNVLIFNRHQPYVGIIAKSGVPMAICGAEKHENWATDGVPMPDNCYEISDQDAQKKDWDLVICLDMNDVERTRDWECRRLFVALNAAHTDMGTLQPSVPLKRAQRLLTSSECNFSSISKMKGDSWGLDGPVIRSGVDVGEMKPYSGWNKTILRVGNDLAGRHMMGYDIQQEILSGLPVTTAGRSEGVLDSKPTGWKGMKDLYSDCRVLIQTLRPEWEDGYNLSTLEAMAAGMPVVFLANPTCPMNGLESALVYDDPMKMRDMLNILLDSPEAAMEAGAKGREVVAKDWTMKECADAWRFEITRLAKGGSRF
jgi:hypothetical protein